MNRIPVHEVIDERPVPAVDAAARAGVFRPLVGDECRVTVTDVVRSLGDSGGGPPSEWLEDGGACVRRPVVIGEAECTLDRGLEAVVRGMAVGELREFCVGDGRGGRVTGRVELSAVATSRGSFETGRGKDQLKMCNAARHKKAGNRLYALGRYVDAFHRFNQAVRCVLFVRDVDATYAPATWDELYASVCNNMAACQLQMANYEHVVRLCSKVLAVEPDNCKALMRRCRASVELRAYDAAAADARSVLRRGPNNAQAKRYLDEAVRGIQAGDNVYRDMVKKMFA